MTLPLVVIKGYPFLEGSINGTKGKLLFDVGEKNAFAIDSHTVAVPDGRVIGQGNFGSGQTHAVLRFPLVKNLTLPSGLHYENMREITGNSGLPLEQHITPDFIGWIGVAFWKGSVFKLDYDKPAVTFYREDGSGAGEKAAEAGEQVLQTISVQDTKPPHLLLFWMKAGATPIEVTLDTGAHNTAWLSDDQIAALKAAGTLRELEDGKIVLSGLTIEGKPFEPMSFELVRGRAPFTKLLPDADAPLLALGYEFHSQYKTVWNYEGKTFTLLAK